MRLTTKGRFAVTAMLDLALNQGSLPVNLADISRRQNISLSYLEQLFGKLRRADLVCSLRGPGGGYFLSRADREISVMDIVRAVDDDLDATQCHGKTDCHHDTPCMTHQLWSDLNKIISTHLSSVSLANLVANQKNQPEQLIRTHKNYNERLHLEADI